MPSDLTSSRRQFIAACSAAVLAPRTLHSQPIRVTSQPDSATVFTENNSLTLTRDHAQWRGGEVELRITPQHDSSAVTLLAPRDSVLRIHLRWQQSIPADVQFLGDAWERSYGDLGWRSMEPERILPWYFLAYDGASTFAIGVETAPAAFCFWQVDPAGISLWLDVRNGGRGVKLGGRQLQVTSIATEFYPQTKPFAAAKQFCHRLSPTPRLPSAPVYGGNNWYYAYGHSSAADIRADSERMSELAPSTQNRPFMVIDDGWSPNLTAGPWSHGNARFPDMPQLAANMQAIGVRPGLWLRPLFTQADVSPGWRLASPNAAREYTARQAVTLDPTVPEALASIEGDLRTIAGWGYQLIKHDFSTYDLLGRWGFNMGAEVTDPNWSFADQTRTNAEIIRDFYRALRDSAGSAVLLGCNSVGHLSAGLFELQRIGDDTSGRDWNRTRKMGVNTLAFRAPQHNAFFAVDADCVGLTNHIPWNFNRQWLDLLARSGTPLFVSAAPDALGPEQRSALRKAFMTAAAPLPLLEPSDWLTNTEPQKWIMAGQPVTYRWFGDAGVSPFPV